MLRSNEIGNEAAWELFQTKGHLGPEKLFLAPSFMYEYTSKNNLSSIVGTELSPFLKWNLISVKWNALTLMTS